MTTGSDRRRDMPSGLGRLNAADDDRARDLLHGSCSSTYFARELAARRPFASVDELLVEAESVAETMCRDDWLEAFAHHPRIGDRTTLASGSKESAEQSGMHDAAADVAARIAELNAVYEAHFGMVYLVCASGRSPQELLEILERRLADGDPATEWRVAADEQRRITTLRLRTLAADD